MKMLFLALTLSFSASSFAALIQLNTDTFEQEFRNLKKQKGYNGQITSNGYTHEKFLVTAKVRKDLPHLF